MGVGEEVYEGMVVGESSRGGELDVNPCRAKKLSNVRSTGAEEKVSLEPAPENDRGVDYFVHGRGRGPRGYAKEHQVAQENFG